MTLGGQRVRTEPEQTLHIDGEPRCRHRAVDRHEGNEIVIGRRHDPIGDGVVERRKEPTRREICEAAGLGQEDDVGAIALRQPVAELLVERRDTHVAEFDRGVGARLGEHTAEDETGLADDAAEYLDDGSLDPIATGAGRDGSDE